MTCSDGSPGTPSSKSPQGGCSRAAFAPAEEPSRFLSTVQFGITLIGIRASALSGASFGGRLAAVLMSYGLSAGVAGPLTKMISR